MSSASTHAPAPGGPRVVICTTGGTIAGDTDPSGAVRAGAEGSGTQVATWARPTADGLGLGVEVRPVCAVDSAALRLKQIEDAVAAVHDALADPEVVGVVVTHGTDTLEETAMAVDLVHTDQRPVVVTGAQRAADHPDSDGPANVADAVRIAADPSARGIGVLVVFGRAVLQARGTRKWHTEDLLGFAREAGGGEDGGNAACGDGDGSRPVVSAPARGLLTAARVDVVAAHVDSDDVALRAVLEAGARGVVVEGTGSGNISSALGAALAELEVSRPDVVVVASSRVPRGPVAARYSGRGGGADLARSGVLFAGHLRASQARILLLALFAEAGEHGRESASGTSYGASHGASGAPGSVSGASTSEGGTEAERVRTRWADFVPPY